MAVVERVTTVLSRFAMGEALIDGHRRYFGGLPSLARLSVAWSHCALEHAAGALLYCFNFGNVTCGPTWPGDLYIMRVPPPDPPVLRFRAFSTADAGAVDYWTMLAQHYRPALPMFDLGRGFDAAIVLGRLGYYTADPQRYSAGVARWQAWFAANLSSSYAAELSEGRGNSLLSQDDIDEQLRSIEPKDGRRIDDPILDNLRTKTTDRSPDDLEEPIDGVDVLTPKS